MRQAESESELDSDELELELEAAAGKRLAAPLYNGMEHVQGFWLVFTTFFFASDSSELESSDELDEDATISREISSRS